MTIPIPAEISNSIICRFIIAKVASTAARAYQRQDQRLLESLEKTPSIDSATELNGHVVGPIHTNTIEG